MEASMHGRQPRPETLFALVALVAACANAQQPMTPPDLRDGLRTGTAAGALLDTALLANLAQSTKSTAFPRTTSILVARAGALVYEGYFGDGSREVLNDTRSATKTVTALAVGAAIADGRISSVAASVLSYFAAERVAPPFALADAMVTLALWRGHDRWWFAPSLPRSAQTPRDGLRHRSLAGS